MRITKVTVGKGKAAKTSEGGENKTYYELEVELTEEGELEEAKGRSLKLVEGWLKPTVALDPAVLGKLPWMSYARKGQLAQEDESGWLFTNAEGAENLVKAIKSSEKGSFRVENFEYTFSGDHSQFVKRRLLKPRPKTAFLDHPTSVLGGVGEGVAQSAKNR